MITTKQLEIFEVFTKKPFAEHSRNEIKSITKDKSNNKLALTINNLKEEDVIVEKIVGKSGLLSLNLNNDLTLSYMAVLNNLILSDMVKQSLKELNSEIIGCTSFYSMTIFGSYALGQQKKASDLDIAIFIDDEKYKKPLIAAINSAKLKSIIELDVHIILKNEMLEMLSDNSENLGKQIARKHLAIHNPRIFYDLVEEGIKHGFRI